MFHEFSTANIQIDKDFSAKLSGYGCITNIQETEISCNSVVSSLIYCCSNTAFSFIAGNVGLKI